MRTEWEFRNLARHYRQLATEADDTTAVNLAMLAEDYEGHADMLEGEPRSDRHQWVRYAVPRWARDHDGPISTIDRRASRGDLRG